MLPTFRGRFAPSPTGKLHLGNARSALLGWLQARAAGGAFLLRIEDLDRGRSRPEHVERIFRDLEWLGLTWDGTPIFQSERDARYREALLQLHRDGRIYGCRCSRAEIARASSAPHLGEEGPRYPGTCRSLDLDLEGPVGGRPCALRFIPAPGIVRFEDLVMGPQEQDVAEVVGDFVVRRNDGVASYQLAVVVDDADSGITDVLRGEDLLGSTARQLQLYEALGLQAPRFAHVPLVNGEDGRRLAKREGAFALSDLREAGVPAEKVLGLLALWSGLSNGAPIAADELVSGFRLDQVARSPAQTSESEIREALGL
ncbi:MAG TPA: tRNA glutamyl-Q(34) synthetase GluQRS [Myxococcaceae bacterium]|nr:tRNA glutamyl-Q(34) synthetase GluQRS [Myxococcaceae bacterium]